MASTLALLEYLFLFDPEKTWQHLSQFESDLGEFFKSKGYEAQIVPTVDSQSSRRILFLTREQLLDTMRTDNTEHPEAQQKSDRKSSMLQPARTTKQMFNKYRGNDGPKSNSSK